MTERDLGEKIDWADATGDGDLPFPGKENPFTTGESVDTPFVGMPTPTGLNAQYKPSGRQEKTQQTATPSAHKPEAVPAQGRISTSRNKQLQRFREAFGLKRIKIQPYTVTRAVNGENVKMTFQLRPMAQEDFAWMVEKANTVIRNGRATPQLVYQMAAVAMSICGLDEGENIEKPTPIWQVFDIDPGGLPIADPFNPPFHIRAEAADFMWEEMRDSLYNLVTELYEATGILIDSQFTPRAPKKDEGEAEGEVDPLV